MIVEVRVVYLFVVVLLFRIWKMIVEVAFVMIGIYGTAEDDEWNVSHDCG